MSIFWIVAFALGWITTATPAINHKEVVKRQVLTYDGLGHWKTIEWEEPIK